MSYKIIDGKAYKVEEVNVDTIKAEVDAALLQLAEIESKKNQVQANYDNTCKQYDCQIENYEKQRAALEEAINSIKARKVVALSPYEEQLTEYEKSLVEVKSQLVENKDIIEALMPEDAKKLAL